MTRLAFKPRLKGPERRATIERAGAELFATRGYEASSVEGIARAAGVTKRVLYDHFESKRALHIALLERSTDELIGFVAAQAGTARGADARMAAGVGAFFEFVEQHPFAWRMLFRDAPTDPAVAVTHREVQARATTAIAALLASDARLRIVDGSRGPHWLEMMAELLKASLNGLAGWWYEHRDITREQVVSTALDFVWFGFRGVTGPGAEMTPHPSPTDESR